MHQAGENGFRRRSPTAFEVYLRTGRKLSPGTLRGPVELKFNPWHDPDDGRFTFAGGGGYFPGGGGSFGGGGATGRFDWPTKKPKVGNPRKAAPLKPAGAVRGGQARGLAAPPKRTPARTRAAIAGTKPRPSPSTPELRRETRRGYSFDIDSIGRTREVSGTLRLGPVERRSRSLQRDAGKPDRQPKDDGGHYIAPRFGGPREAFNHFAQDSGINRGKYRVYEDRWAKALRQGKRVTVRIRPVYLGSSQRPSGVRLRFVVDGAVEYRGVGNRRKGK